MRHAALAAGHDLPAVAWDAGGPGGRIDLRRGREPAHVPHIGAARREERAVVERREEIVDRPGAVFAPLPYLGRDRRVGARPDAGKAFLGRAVLSGH